MNKKNFYSLSNDIIFKNTFNTDDALKRLLKETLNLNINKIHKNSAELSVENKRNIEIAKNMIKKN